MVDVSDKRQLTSFNPSPSLRRKMMLFGVFCALVVVLFVITLANLVLLVQVSLTAFILGGRRRPISLIKLRWTWTKRNIYMYDSALVTSHIYLWNMEMYAIRRHSACINYLGHPEDAFSSLHFYRGNTKLWAYSITSFCKKWHLTITIILFTDGRLCFFGLDIDRPYFIALFNLIVIGQYWHVIFFVLALESKGSRKKFEIDSRYVIPALRRRSINSLYTSARIVVNGHPIIVNSIAQTSIWNRRS